MTFLGAPWLLLGPAMGAGAAALVGLYLLKQRRRRLEVPFAQLWQHVLSESQSTALWRKLRRLVSLALQLVLLALLVFAIADPRLAASQSGRSIVLVVDCSASMQALDGDAKQSRLQSAKAEARRLVRALAADDTAMVLAMDARPAPVSGFQSDERELEREVDGLTASDSAADLDRALRLAADALHGRPRPTLVLIGDGAWDDATLARIKLSAPGAGDAAKQVSTIWLPGVDLRFIPVGRSDDNVGITAFAVRRYQANQTAYEVLVEVHSFRSRPSTVKLELAQDGEVVESEALELKPGERIQRVYPDLAGEGARLTARLVDTHDVLPLDDVAYAVLPARKKQKVLLVTGGNLFLEGALLLDENLSVDKVAPAAYDAARTAAYDAVVLDGLTPEEPPRSHALYLDPHGDKSPFAVLGTIDAPYVTEAASAHPLMRWVALKDLNIAHASRFKLSPDDVAVASSMREPIIAARQKDGRKTVALGFRLEHSDLPLRVAFPVLLINALDWFAGGDAALAASYATGRTWRLPAKGAALRIREPDGSVVEAPVHDGRASFFGTRAGWYQILASPPELVAANLANDAESQVAPRATLTVDGRTLVPPDSGRVGVRRALWSYFVVLALLLAFVEWWTYNRRVTV
jgi:hypothetical protein